MPRPEPLTPSMDELLNGWNAKTLGEYVLERQHQILTNAFIESRATPLLRTQRRDNKRRW